MWAQAAHESQDPHKKGTFETTDTYVDVAWSICLSVCVLVTTVSPAKTAELIRWQTRVSPKNHVLDGCTYG